jgi:hypothetical protein
MEQAIDFFNYMLDLIKNLPNNSDSFMERVVMWSIIAYFEMKIHVIEFSYGIASSILSGLNISDLINTHWSGMNSSIKGAITYLRIPESINIILSAMLTRFVMDLLPI